MVAIRAAHSASFVSDDDDLITSTTTKTAKHKGAHSIDKSSDDDLSSSATSTASRKANTSSTTPRRTLTVGANGQTSEIFDIAKGTIQSTEYSSSISASHALASASPLTANPAPAQSKLTLYAVIATTSIILLALIVALSIFCYKRNKSKHEDDEAFRFGNRCRSSNVSDFRPGQGPSARRMQLSDSDSDIAIKDYNDEKAATDAGYAADQLYPYRHAEGAVVNPYTPYATDNFDQQPMTQVAPVNNVHQAPTRPRRPSVQYDFTVATPPVAHTQSAWNGNQETQDGQDADAYRRHIQALDPSTTYGHRANTGEAPLTHFATPAPVPTADSAQRVQVTRKPSQPRKTTKKDTIIGFAENYGDIASDPDETMPVRPLTLQGSASVLERQLSVKKQDAAIPAKSPVLGIPANITASLRDLEQALDAFGSGHDESPATVTTASFSPRDMDKTASIADYGYRAPNRVQIVAHTDGANESKTQYRITRSGATQDVGGLVQNTLSVHSNAAEFVDMESIASPAMPGDPTTHGDAHTIARKPSFRTTVKKTQPSAGRRMSVASARSTGNKRESSLGDSRLQQTPFLPGASVLRSSVATSTTSFYDDDRSMFHRESQPFQLEKEHRVAEAVSIISSPTPAYLSPHPTHDMSFATRRSQSASVAVGQIARPTRSRTSTLHGVQLPPAIAPPTSTPATQRKRTETTDTVFALGASMLRAFPDSPQASPNMQSPDLRIHPPSPSQASDITQFSVPDNKTTYDYQKQLAADGFVPLSQMSLQHKTHDQYYQSPVDAVIGDF